MMNSSTKYFSATHKFVSVAFLLMIVFVIGCGGGKKRVPVAGSITVDGKPADGATLLFHPIDSKDAPIGSGSADQNGKFSVVSDLKDGLMAGSYKVSVVWPDPAVKPTAAQKMTGLFDPGPDLLKGRFDSQAKTTLKVDITSSTKELPPFELKTK
ncbi:MAG: hypothetical protein ABL921_22120 [Pirellula sp.]